MYTYYINRDNCALCALAFESTGYRLTNMEEPTLYLLAQRLLSSPTFLNSEPSEPQLLLGRLPEQFPRQVPLPEDARIIGCLIEGPDKFQVVFESGLSSREVLDLYRQAIIGIGGHERNVSSTPTSSREVFPNIADNTARFLLPHPLRRLAVIASALRDSVTDVRLRFHGIQDSDQAGSTPLSVVGTTTAGEVQPQELTSQNSRTTFPVVTMPFLEPPEGIEEFATFHGGLDTMGRFITLTLTTQHSTQILASYFGEQLERSGWQSDTRGTSGSFSWSTWRIVTGSIQSRGYLCVQEWPGIINRKLVFVRAESYGSI